MRISFSLKFLFLVIFFLVAFSLEKCENLKLRELTKSASGGGGVDTLKSAGGVGKTKIRFPFRKLEKSEIVDDDDEDDDDEDEDDDDDDEKFKFESVRKPSHEVKKRSNFRFSKLAQLKNDKDSNEVDDDEDDEDDDEDEEVSPSLFQKVINFFTFSSKKSNTETTKAENDDEEDDEDDDEDEEETTAITDLETEKKSLFSEVLDIFQEFWDTKTQIEQSKNENDDDDDDDEKEEGSSSEDDKDEDNNDDGDENVRKSDNKIRISIKRIFNQIFNRMPFNLIFDFNDDDDSDDSNNFEDSEEDDINYQKLLKEEQDQMQKQVDKLTSSAEEPHLIESSSSINEDSEKSENKPIARVNKPKKSKEETHLAQKEFEKLLLNLPSFVPDYSKVKNPECQKQGEVFQRQLRGQRIWALQMMDANAKIPSGLLRGNTNQLGDFDLCTKISQKIRISSSNTMKMRGKYCLANIDVVAAADELKLPVHLIQGRNFIRSTINDPNHFFPRYSTINWGLCLPSACTYQDADHILESFIGPYNSTGIKLHINVNEDSCYVRQHFDLFNTIKNDWRVLATIVILLIFIAVTLISSFNDYLAVPFMKHADGHDNKLWMKIVKCFSIKKNMPKLLGVVESSSSSNEKDEIECLHGLKSISIILLFLSIKLISIGRIPYTNRNKLTEFFNSPLSIFLRTSFLYEDIFLLISGVLAAFSYIKVMNNFTKVLLVKKLLIKALRIALPLSVVLLFYAFVWEHLGTGPQWSSIVERNADLCKENLWQNLLFIQNAYPTENMCATHTYHLAIYFQLLIITPLLIWTMQQKPTLGVGIYGVIHGISAAARFSSTVENRLSAVVFHGMKLTQIYRTFNLSLTLVLHRATPFITGIALALMLKECGKERMPKGFVMSGWISAISGFIWCFYTPSNLSQKDYLYDPMAAAQYYAMAPIIWSLTISWIIYACYTDSTGNINKFLSSRPMKIIGNLSFSTYLIVFLILFSFSGSVKSAEEFMISSYIDRVEFLILFIVSILFALIVDQPVKNIIQLLEGGQECLSKENGTHKVENSAEEDDADDPFAGRDEDYVYRPRKSYYADEEPADHSNLNGKEVNGNVADDEDKPKSPMNAKRWRWEVLDDE